MRNEALYMNQSRLIIVVDELDEPVVGVHTNTLLRVGSLLGVLGFLAGFLLPFDPEASR
jgi:hypothetical protein